MKRYEGVDLGAEVEEDEVVTVSDEVVVNGKTWSVNFLKKWVRTDKIKTRIHGHLEMGNNDVISIKKDNIKSKEPFLLTSHLKYLKVIPAALYCPQLKLKTPLTGLGNRAFSLEWMSQLI